MISNDGSRANAAIAASSALLAPPTRQEGSSRRTERFLQTDQAACRHGAPYLGRHRERIENFPTAEHAHELGSAVNRPPLIVRHGPLRSVVADPKVADRNLPDAQCPDLAQVLLEMNKARIGARSHAA
jgi:hypothetical protein